MTKMHQVNGAVRFLLELGAITTFAVWGFHQGETITGIILAIALPLGFALLWGIFAVKDDPSRSGKTVVPTPGVIRLILELGLFAGAAWMQLDLGHLLLGWIFCAVVVLHYLVSFARITWLLKQK